MPQWCIVVGCLTNSCRRKNEPEALKRHIFRFPICKDLFKKWAEVVPYKRTHKLSVLSSGVCELHFEEKYIQRDFRNVIGGEVIKMPRSRVTLTTGAVPSLFPGRVESPPPRICSYAKQRLPSAGTEEVNNSGTRTYVRKAAGKGPADGNDDGHETIEEEYVGEGQLSDSFFRDLRGISEAPLILKTEPMEEEDVPWQLDAASGLPGHADPDSWQLLPCFGGETAGGQSSSSCAASETHSYIPAVPAPDVPSAFAPGESCDNEVLPAVETIWIPEIKNEQDEFQPRPNNPLDNDSAEREFASIAKPFDCSIALPRQHPLKRKKPDLFPGGSSQREPKLLVPVSAETFLPNVRGVTLLGGLASTSKCGSGTVTWPVSSVLLTTVNSPRVPKAVRLVCSAPEVAVQTTSEPKVTSKRTDISVLGARQRPWPIRPLLPASDRVARERKVQKLSEPTVTQKRIDFSDVRGGQVPTMLRKLRPTPETVVRERKIQELSEPKVTPRRTDFSDTSGRQVCTVQRKLCPAPDLAARGVEIVQKLSEPKVTPRRTDLSDASGRQECTVLRKLCPAPDLAARGVQIVQKLSEPKGTPRRTDFSRVSGGQVPTILRKLCPAPDLNARGVQIVQRLSEPKGTPRRTDFSRVSGGQVPTMLRNLLNAPGEPSLRQPSWAEIESKEIERLRLKSPFERRRRYMEKVQKAQDIHTFFSAVTQCCKYKCYTAIPHPCQRDLFQTFYGFGDYNKQNHFLARLMRRCVPAGAAQRGGCGGGDGGGGGKAGECVLWRYHLIVDGAKKLVCKQMLNAVFQINVNRVDVVQSRLFENKFDLGDGAAQRRRLRDGEDAWIRLRRFCESLPHGKGRCDKTGADVNYFAAQDLTLGVLLEEFRNFNAEVTGRLRSFNYKTFESQFFHRINFRFQTGTVSSPKV